MSPDRWVFGNPKRAAYAMIFMALAIVVLAVWNYNLNGRVSAGEAVRIADNNAKRAARVAAKRRAQSECRSSIKSARQGRTIIEDLRSTYLELADNAQNPAFVKALRSRAKHLPMFPPPTCDPGPKVKR